MNSHKFRFLARSTNHNEKLSLMKDMILNNIDRIQQKSEQAANTEMDKYYEIAERYEDAQMVSAKKFEIIDKLISKIEDIKQKEDPFAQQLEEATALINSRFEQEAQCRAEFEAKFKSILNDRFDTLKSDLIKESQTRVSSINSLKQCIENDFEKVEAELQETEQAAENTDNELNKIFDDLLERVHEENEQVRQYYIELFSF